MKCPGVPHSGHASSDWTCPRETDEDRRQARMLVAITLSDDEQEVILRHAGYYPDSPPWMAMAEKIKRARADAWSGDPVKFPGPGGS